MTSGSYYQDPLPINFTPRNQEPLAIDGEFDVHLANDLAKSESFNKHLYRPNSYLHKWWARRCGTTFRMILKSLVEDPAKRDYYVSGGLEGKIICDPMMGGGTTLHEAVRLGANVIGLDLDPIPVLQVRATLSEIPLRKLEMAFHHFYGSLRQRLSSFFMTQCPQCGKETDIQFTLYGLARSCSCGPVLFLDSTILRYESNGSLVRICPRCHKVTSGASCECMARGSRPPIVEKGTSSCPTCGEVYVEEITKPFYQRYAPLVVVGRCNHHGLFFKGATAYDLAKIQEANEKRPAFEPEIPDEFSIQPGPKSRDLIQRSVFSYLDLFSSRQLLYLHHSIELLRDIEPLVRLNLALLVSTSLEFNSSLCGYKGGDKRRPGAVRHTFSHHAYSFPYTALENNPLFPGKTSGTLHNLFVSRIHRGRLWALRPRERMIGSRGVKTVVLEGEFDAGTEVDSYSDLTSGMRRFLLIQGSSTAISLVPNSVDYVVTDPPYFDSVQYSDLAAFFRVWLRRFLPKDADWHYDITQSAVDSNTNNGNGKYAELLAAIFRECHRILKKDRGRLIFTFHHWNPKGWTSLTLALKRAQFVLVNRHIVHSENPTSVHISYQNALKHDAVLIMAPSGSVCTPSWTMPEIINKTDSYLFCEDCATTLGWMLHAKLKEEEIANLWVDLLKGP